MFDKKKDDWAVVENKALYYLSSVGLKGKEKNRPSELSGGELRRAEIARLLILDNDIMILDEPTSGMDEECIEILNNIFKELKKENKTIIVSTHDERVITNIVDRIYMMKNGKIYEKV